MGAVGDLQVSQWINLGKEGKAFSSGLRLFERLRARFFPVDVWQGLWFGNLVLSLRSRIACPLQVHLIYSPVLSPGSLAPRVCLSWVPLFLRPCTLLSLPSLPIVWLAGYLLPNRVQAPRYLAPFVKYGRPHLPGSLHCPCRIAFFFFFLFL
jgi:hypothetical protein